MSAELSRQRGMTLVEVLVAMTILAGIAVSAMLMTAQSARLGVSVEQKLMARIIADNSAVAALATNISFEEAQVNTVKFAGLDWRVHSTANDTGIEGLLHITISVSLIDNSQVLARIETLKVQQE